MLSGKRLDLLRLLALTLLVGTAGCVERRMVIITEPNPGAATAIAIDENFKVMGATPVDKPFTYYGTYKFRFAKDGYETLDVVQRVQAPWYEYPGLDFISENLIPWTIRDRREFHYQMVPTQVRTPEQLQREAQLLREYGMTIGDPNQVANPRTPGTVLLPPTVPSQ